ncbi:MAG: ETC complex I subunit [Pseudomonadota bacterium]
MLARIYQPSKTAMQSGKAKTSQWLLEFEAAAAKRIDPLMGWTSGSDTAAGQVKLQFSSKEAAVDYAEKHRIPFQVIETAERTQHAKAYADNFAFRRRSPWTH